MRISDWSSDVCSSDLTPADGFAGGEHRSRAGGSAARFLRAGGCRGRYERQSRSEEHTSELQSLMRISYAVFCLKKKNKPNSTHRVTHIFHSTKIQHTVHSTRIRSQQSSLTTQYNA